MYIEKSGIKPKSKSAKKKLCISPEVSTSMRDLTIVLANEMALYVKVKMIIWNISGKNLKDLFSILNNQYVRLDKTTNEVADRIYKLGGKKIGTISELVDYSQFNVEINHTNQTLMLEELSNEHGIIAIQIKKFMKNAEAIADVETADFLANILQMHQLKSWIMRKYLGKHIFYNL